MRVPSRTGNAWPLEQVFMEIISGNPNVNKSLADPGMREGGERLEDEQYSRQIKKNKGGEGWRLSHLG